MARGQSSTKSRTVQGRLERKNQAIFQSALGWGMGVFTCVIAKEKNWADTSFIQDKLRDANIAAVMNLLAEWNEMGVLADVRRSTLDYLSI